MARKIAVLLVILVTVGALLLISCSPKASAPTPSVPTSGTPTPAVPTPATPAPGTPAAPAPAAPTEKPKYGGTVNVMDVTDIAMFMPNHPTSIQTIPFFTYEMVTSGDWSRGPAGTGETNYGDGTGVGGVATWEYVWGHLAESMEIPELGVWILNIRKGVHWALDPKSEASRLVNGREMTADDIVSSIMLAATTKTGYSLISQRALFANLTAEKTGPWQVTVRTPVDPGVAYQWILGGSGVNHIYAKEVIEKYGQKNDWRDVVGTGPYMLTDFVSGSVATLTRNPNYWQKNPVGPGKGDQLPYPDFVKIQIVPDLSTRLAAMRTGKTDVLGGMNMDSALQADDARALFKTNPKILFKTVLPNPTLVTMRTDKPNLPYYDKRVRQALMMATDFEAIKREFYGGEAEILSWPVAPTQGTKGIHVPLEQLPESVRSLYEYNPARAKQLLVEAGYPAGFKANVIVRSTAVEMDLIAIVKAMWAKVGIDLEIQPRDAGVFASIQSGKTHEEMLFKPTQPFTAFGQRYSISAYYGATNHNHSYVGFGRGYPADKDPVIEAAFQEIQKNVVINYSKADQIISELLPYLLEGAYYIPMPTPYSYRLWQPWLKNYYGESSPKYWGALVWVDQDLKEKMTGRR